MNKKNILLGILALIVLAVAVSFFFGEEETPVYDEFGNLVEAQVVGADLLATLALLQRINLEAPVLSSPVFTNLIDRGVILPSPILGRPNPFERIGTDVGAVTPQPQQVSTSSSVSVQN